MGAVIETSGNIPVVKLVIMDSGLPAEDPPGPRRVLRVELHLGSQESKGPEKRTIIEVGQVELVQELGTKVDQHGVVIQPENRKIDWKTIKDNGRRDTAIVK